MILLRLALLSLRNRLLTVSLTVLAIAVSVALLIGVEKVRNGARASFANTIAGTDLIVGARGGSVQLLLYSVFRIGNAANNVTWQSVEEIRARPEVAWTIPFSLGDSHRGYRVLGTSTDYFRHYRFRADRGLEFSDGLPFDDLFDAVLGAEVAAALGYRVGDPIVIDHGLGGEGFASHDDRPFRVSGILAPTGTPVDRTVHVSLEAIEAIHLDWRGGTRRAGRGPDADTLRAMDLQPGAVTALLVGLKSRLSVFRLQRFVNTYRAEPLTAILPGVALQELWSLIGVGETALAAVSLMVVLTALIGMAAMILAALEERRREMAILRSVGARPATILGLLVMESGLLSLLGVIAGFLFAHGLALALRPVLDSAFGLDLPIAAPSGRELAMLAAIALAGFAAGLLPAWRAYRLSLADGMTVRT